MSETAQERPQYRANVSLRRKLYVVIILLAIAVFALAVVDILWLDEALYYGVLGGFGVLFLWALLMLFSRRHEYEVISTAMEKTYLRCKTCRHVFGFDMQHPHEARKPVVFTCPECGTPGRLPVDDSHAQPAAVPGGGTEGPRFKCDACDEHWSVGALGHTPKAEVRFEACPHCGEKGQMRLLEE